MKVKLRPGTHFVPVSEGLYCARGDRSFVLKGPPALYQAVDDQLGNLTAGTDLDTLVRVTGGEAGRPVWRHVLTTLLSRDILLDLDRVSPQPDPDDSTRFRDVLSWLESMESQVSDPYATFARIRNATVAVAGADGPARDSLVRGLAQHGVGTVLAAADAVAPELVVQLDGGQPVTGTPAIQVRTASGYALVSSAAPGVVELLAQRVDRWQQTDEDRGSSAPLPLSAVLAGSLAAYRALQQLAGVRTAGQQATIVHSHSLQTDVVELAEPAPLEPQPPVEPDGVPDLQAQLNAGALTARWTGIVRLGRDLDLPQLPLALVTARLLEVPDEAPVLGFGLNRAAAGVNAILAALRRFPAGAGELAAAGLTPTRWLLDGALRRHGSEVLDQVPGHELTRDALGAPSSICTVWGLLEEYFQLPVRLVGRSAPDTGWHLVSVQHRDSGTVLASQWGQTAAGATQLALFAAVAQAQLGELLTTQPTEPVGTAILETARGERLRELAGKLLPQGRRAPADPLLQSSGYYWGTVTTG
jgi:hypothetical protein